MDDVLKLYIDGQWTDSSDSEVIEVINPTTGQATAVVPRGSSEDVDRAVAAAQRAWPTWSQTPVSERANLLRAVSVAILEEGEQIARLAATDVGTPVSTGRYMHVKLPATTFADMADRIEAFEFERQDGRLTLLRESVGVVGCITPWNYPLHQIAAKIAPALAAGCTVVVKPSEVAPLSAWALARIVDRVGFPSGVFNLVSGYGPLVGEALASHRNVDMMTFTGSVRAGTRVGELASGGAKRLTLELGGKSPNVILDDVTNLDAIVTAAVHNAYLNSGQTCSALTRLIVPAAMASAIEELAVDSAKTQRLGDPLRDDTDLGPVVSAAQFERVRGYIASGVKEGARLLIGGTERPAGMSDGFFVAPTVFAGVNMAMTIAKDEIFGPVLSIMPYETEAEAIEIANGTQYGLSGGVWSADPARATRVARQLRTGQVKINGGAFNPVAPFGGYRMSGVGRELGQEGLEEFFEVKALTY